MIERSSGCNHMTCRRSSGGCGFQFCWLCKEEYQSGHFDGGRCPQYGGNPAYDIFGGSRLALLRSPLVLFFGIAAAEVIALPQVGLVEMLWCSALGLAGFVALKATKTARTCVPPLVAIIVAPFTAVGLVIGWFNLRARYGDYCAAPVAFFVLEATGWLADPPPRLFGRHFRKYLCRRVLGVSVPVGAVTSVIIMIMCVESVTKSPSCFPHCRTLTQYFVLFLRYAIEGMIIVFVMMTILGGTVVTCPGFGDIVHPNSLWMGVAGVARVIGVAALLTSCPVTIDGFYSAGGWGFVVLAFLTLLFFSGITLVSTFSQRMVMPSWPTPYLAAFSVWMARFLLETRQRMNGSFPSQEQRHLVAYAYLLSGVLAGAALLLRAPSQQTEAAPLAVQDGQRQRLSWRRFKSIAIRTSVAMCGAAIGVAMFAGRYNAVCLLIERLLAGTLLAVGTVGFSALGLWNYSSILCSCS